jgi:hypothetical protein
MGAKLSRSVAKADILDTLPGLGRMMPEVGDENVREIPMYSYRIITCVNCTLCLGS